MKAFKALSWASRVLAVLATVGTVVLMFFGLATVTSGDQSYTLSAFQLSFGTTVDSVDFWKSSYFLFAVITAVIAVICSVASLKKKRAAIGSLVFSALTMVLYIMFAIQTPASNVDIRPLTSGTVAYTGMFWAVFALSIAAVVLTVVSIFVVDAVEVKESNGARKTLLKRFGAWLKEYKSEIKKITWPTFKTVVRNSVLVLLCCLLIGIVIWVVDFGLSQLIQLIF